MDFLQEVDSLCSGVFWGREIGEGGVIDISRSV